MTKFDQALFKRHNIGELVEIYSQAKDTINQAYADLADAEEILKAAGIEYADTLPNRNRRFRKGENTPQAGVIGELNERIWRHVVDLMEIRKFLSIKKAKELDDQLDKGSFPAVTYDNIFNTFLSLMAQAGDFAQDQIKEVYNWLRPYSDQRDKYKTNSIWEVGKKVIKYGIECPWNSEGNWRITYHYEQNFIALDKAFHTLDGAPVPSNTYNMPLADAIRSCTWEIPQGSTEYFSFKLYKNGNIHITFLRPDLVREFNRVAGGEMLKEGNPAKTEERENSYALAN